jgi:hypothetical protein
MDLPLSDEERTALADFLSEAIADGLYPLSLGLRSDRCCRNSNDPRPKPTCSPFRGILWWVETAPFARLSRRSSFSRARQHLRSAFALSNGTYGSPRMAWDLRDRAARTLRLLHACTGGFRLERFRWVGLAPTGKPAFSRRAPTTAFSPRTLNGSVRWPAAVLDP